MDANRPEPTWLLYSSLRRTPSADEAVAKVFESIHAEVKSLYRDGYPRCIELDEVLEDPKGFAKYGPGTGFTWYPEEAEQTEDY